jgi:hypothetical protein
MEVRMKKIFLIIVAALSTAIFVYTLYNICLILKNYVGFGFEFSDSKERAEKYFIKNQDTILFVKDYLINSLYEEIQISSYNGANIMWTGLDTKDVSIENANVIKAVKILQTKGKYRVIGKSGKTIYFKRYLTVKDKGSGIAYSIDGSEPILQFLTKLEPFSEKGWYYHEEDYDEWRIRQQN